jgi:hypothetical protein
MYCPKLEVFLSVVLLTAFHAVGSKATLNEDTDLFKASPKGPAADQSTNSNFTFSLPGLSARSNVFGSLYNRQEETCEYPVPCDGNTWCCPEGSQCVLSSLQPNTFPEIPLICVLRSAQRSPIAVRTTRTVDLEANAVRIQQKPVGE